MIRVYGAELTPMHQPGEFRGGSHGSRISLDVLVADFKQGKTPEAIHRDYGTVSLADVCVIFAYYLRHRTEVEVYLAEQERDGAEIQARIEARDPPEGLRAKLLARRDS